MNELLSNSHLIMTKNQRWDHKLSIQMNGLKVWCPQPAKRKRRFYSKVMVHQSRTFSLITTPI